VAPAIDVGANDDAAIAVVSIRAAPVMMVPIVRVIGPDIDADTLGARYSCGPDNSEQSYESDTFHLFLLDLSPKEENVLTKCMVPNERFNTRQELNNYSSSGELYGLSQLAVLQTTRCEKSHLFSNHGAVHETNADVDDYSASGPQLLFPSRFPIVELL
jgi:hypothetical protein